MSRLLKVKDFLNRSIVDDILMIFLAVFSVTLLLIETNSDLTYAQTLAADTIDAIIAFVFLAEWGFRFRAAESKAAFVKKYWWELLTSIPVPNTFVQALRALRILRILRIIRLAARLKQISSFSETLAKHAYVIQILVVFLSITFIASIVFDTFERGINPNIHNTWDGFWWAIATSTTIAYGDIYPMTTAGRIDSIFLALFGLGTLGLLTATIASTFIKEKS